MTSRFCGAASSVMSLMVATTPVEFAGVVEHLVGAHHDQALHAVIGVQADGAVGRRRRLVQAHQHAAVRARRPST